MKKLVHIISLALIILSCIYSIAYCIEEEPSYGSGAGPPRGDEALEALAIEAVIALAKEPTEENINEYVNDMLLIDPSLYDFLSNDKSIADLGIPTTLVLPVGSDVKEFDARTYLKEDMRTLFASGLMNKFMLKFIEGSARPANQFERNIFYSFISFEIYNEPIVVIEADGQVMLPYFFDNKIAFIFWTSTYQMSDKQSSEQESLPTNLKEIYLLTEEDVIQSNLTLEDMLAFGDFVKNTVLDYFDGYENDGFDLLISITLVNDENARIQIQTRPEVDSEVLSPLYESLIAYKSPRTKKDDVSFQMLFQINNGSGIKE